MIRQNLGASFTGRFFPGELALAALMLLAGCAAGPNASNLDNVLCQYTFRGVEPQIERDRIFNLVKQSARPGTLQPAEPPTTVDFQLSFIIGRLSAIDQMHSPLLFASSSARAPSQQVFNAHHPTFFMTYETVTLGARIEVLVNFTITPGAQLFFKTEGEPERDITSSVGPNGAVQIKTAIRKGQEFIYARTVSENVVRYIRINVYTQQAQVISRGEYR
jgi:hypothetical protein